MSDYFIYYTESSIICLIIFGIMLINNKRNMDRQEKQVKYDHALIAFMLYFISDAFWAAAVANIIPPIASIYAFLNFTNCVLMAAVTYTWLRYIQAVESVPGRNTPFQRIIYLLPFVLTVSGMTIAYFINPSLLVDENMMTTPLYSLFQVGVPIIYIVMILFFSLRKAREEIVPYERVNHLYVAFFPLLVVAGGLLQVTLLPGVPIFCYSCTILMLIFYIRSMENRISIDALTGLSNRGHLIRYMSDDDNLRHDELTTYVMMLDIDNFKVINDAHGHASGDFSLKLISDAIRNAVAVRQSDAFVARYGGDEFTIIAYINDPGELDVLAEDINRQLEQSCEENNLPFALSVSYGYDALLPGENSFQACTDRADRELYKNKEQKKVGR